MTKDKFETLMSEIAKAKSKLEAADVPVDRIYITKEYLDAIRGYVGHLERLEGKPSLFGHPVFRGPESLVTSSAKFGLRCVKIEFSRLED